MRKAPTGVKLFFTCWIVYGLHFATNIVREHYPAFSLAERGTFRVDPYLGLHPDIFEVQGRGAFINNNPGASLVAAVPYGLVRPLVDAIVERAERVRRGIDGPAGFNDPRPNRRRFFRRVGERGLLVRFALAAWVTHALCMAPLSAASAVVMRWVLLRAAFTPTASTALAFLYAFGTPVFFRTGHLNHNLMVAHFTLFAFALLYRIRSGPKEPGILAAAGGVLGVAILCDYSAVVSALVLGSYALIDAPAAEPSASRTRTVAWLAAGAALPVSFLLAYQSWAFGNPFLPAQRYMPSTELSARGWYGFARPSLELVLGNLFSLDYGLFAYAPLLALGLLAPYLVRKGRSALPGREVGLALSLFAVMLLFASANQFAWLQWNTGFRMLAPAVPLLFLATAVVLVRLPRQLAIGLGVLSIAHAWCLAMAREGVLASVATIWRHGPSLPWLSTLWRTGFVPALEPSGWQHLAPIFVAGVLVLLLWWPIALGRRRSTTERGL